MNPNNKQGKRKESTTFWQCYMHMFGMSLLRDDADSRAQVEQKKRNKTKIKQKLEI